MTRFLWSGGLNLFVLLFAGSSAWAFPEMIRHGYPRCASCHVSPSGGGVLNDYGRQLSGDLLSSWARENEGQLLAGTVPTPQWMHAGADLRGVQLYRDTPQVIAERFIFMQAELEFGGSWQKWTAVASFGLYGDLVQSRKHWLLYQFSDNTSLRVGKFQPALGLGIPDHTSVLRRGLGFDEGSETYNLEAFIGNEDSQLLVTAIGGRPEDSDLGRETGAALRAATSLGNHSQLGVSVFRGSAGGISRWVGGPFAVWSLMERVFLMGEWELQSRAGQGGFFTYHRLDYEPMQGLHFFALLETAKPAFDSASGQKVAWGPGFQFFPRPRIEITGVWQKQTTPAFPDQTDYATLLLHLYL